QPTAAPRRQTSAEERLRAGAERLSEIKAASVSEGDRFWLERGFEIVLCEHRQDMPGAKMKRAKRPLGVPPDRDADGRPIPRSGGVHKATGSLRQIAEWRRRWPEALIGIPTGQRNGLVVIDLDVRDGERAED